MPLNNQQADYSTKVVIVYIIKKRSIFICQDCSACFSPLQPITNGKD